MDNEKPKMSYKDLMEFITDVPEQLKADPFEQQARKLAEKVFQGGIEYLADLIRSTAIEKYAQYKDSAIRNHLKITAEVPKDFWRQMASFIVIDVQPIAPCREFSVKADESIERTLFLNEG